MPKYSDMTKQQLVRYALKKGRVEPPHDGQESPLLPPFAVALKKATDSDLVRALSDFIHRPKSRYTHRSYRARALANELVRRLNIGAQATGQEGV